LSQLSDLDLDRGVPTTRADVEALRRVRRSRCLSTEQYLLALARLPVPPPEVLEARRRAKGEQPFRLD
jgi:hypothetical protein